MHVLCELYLNGLDDDACLNALGLGAHWAVVSGNRIENILYKHDFHNGHLNDIENF